MCFAMSSQAAELGAQYEREVVHRDDLVILGPART